MYKIDGLLKNSLKIMLLAMAFCLPVSAQAMQALGSRITRISPFLARVGKQATDTLKQPHAFAQAAIRNGVAKPRFNNATLGKTALAAGGLAVTLASTSGASQACAQEESSQDTVKSVDIYEGENILKLRYASGAFKECDLNDYIQTKKWWMKHISRFDQKLEWPDEAVVRKIGKYANPEWIKEWKALPQEELSRQIELASSCWDLDEILPGMVKKMADRSLAEQEERDSERERANTILGINKQVAGLMSVGVGLMGIGFFGYYFGTAPIIPSQQQTQKPQMGSSGQSQDQVLPISSGSGSDIAAGPGASSASLDTMNSGWASAMD
jgi:hypothetical protein